MIAGLATDFLRAAEHTDAKHGFSQGVATIVCAVASWNVDQIFDLLLMDGAESIQTASDLLPATVKDTLERVMDTLRRWPEAALCGPDIEFLNFVVDEALKTWSPQI